MGDDDEEYPAVGVECLRCGVELREDMVTLDLLACPKCRHIELRLPEG